MTSVRFDEPDAQVAATTRRLLQLRRRGPVDPAEIVGLVTPDVVHDEVADDLVRRVEGAAAVAWALRTTWAQLATAGSVTITRHAVVGPTTAVGEWRCDGPDGVRLGRDTFECRGGRVAAITTEVTPVTVSAPAGVR